MRPLSGESTSRYRRAVRDGLPRTPRPKLDLVCHCCIVYLTVKPLALVFLIITAEVVRLSGVVVAGSQFDETVSFVCIAGWQPLEVEN